MFFLVKGKAGVYYGSKLIVIIEQGSYFGEIGCIMGGIRRAGVKALTTCELQALSRRNLNILLAEYPEVGDELKRVARDRASAAKKGHNGSSGTENASKKPAPVSLVHIGGDGTEPDRDISTTPAMDKGCHVAKQDNEKYVKLLDKEIDAIAKTILKKIRQDFALSGSENGNSSIISGKGKGDIT